MLFYRNNINGKVVKMLFFIYGFIVLVWSVVIFIIKY